MTYQERIKQYEREKAKLRLQPLTDKEYEEAIKKLVDKWRL